MRTTIPVKIQDASPKQILIHIFNTVNRMEAIMAKATETLTAIQTAVDGVAQRLLPQLQNLKDALTAAQADDAEVSSALDAMMLEVDRLNALGADPASPVDPEAPNVDEVPEVQVPAELPPEETTEA